jgi:hypothetical protein
MAGAGSGLSGCCADLVSILLLTTTSLGFTAKSIKALETGCEIDFHFVDAATAEFGLNDYIYTMKQQ